MTSCKGCVGEFLLAVIFLVAMAAFVTWSMTTPGGLGQGVYIGAMGVTAVCLSAVAVLVRRAEKGVIETGDVAEQHGGDPLPGVTKAARTGCGTAFAWLSILAVACLLLWIAAQMGGM